MGRVARYKKVKSFEKQYNGDEYVWGSNVSAKTKKRSLTAQVHHRRKLKRKGYREDGGRDLPPGKDDFDLSDLVVKREKKRKLDEGLVPIKHATVVPSSTATPLEGTIKPQAVVKNEKVKIGNTIVQCNIPSDDREEMRAAKILKIDPKTGKSTSKQNAREMSIEGRRKGESMAAFHRRLKEETVNALADNYKKQREPQDEEQLEKRQRKKEYAKMRKLKKKGKLVAGRGSLADEDEDEYDLDLIRRANDAHVNDGFITGEQAAAQISFLEQAEEPPVFQQLPRGAVNKSKLRMSSAKSSGNKGSKTMHMMDEKKIKAEQNAMEIMRRKVQAQYAIMKAKRKQEGASFHL